VTATDEDLRQAMTEGATLGTLLQALDKAGAEPAADLREGLYGPSVAVFGAGGTYRYLLTRRWAPGPVMTWVMLNPSTADAWTDDPTIARCWRRAKAAGFGSIAVVNLFALVATDPGELDGHPDPVGPGNDACLAVMCQPGGAVVAGWGSHGAGSGRAGEVTRSLAGVRFQCLGTTAKGQPRHPGRLAYSTNLTPWEPA